uniref:Uncharacterized protein n=1 Tax=Arundo donax TaxID=35708 RepID=A0A0A9GIA4_ARUDO
MGEANHLSQIESGSLNSSEQVENLAYSSFTRDNSSSMQKYFLKHVILIFDTSVHVWRYTASTSIKPHIAIISWVE